MPSTEPFSLRAFHLVFLLIAIVGADVFGLWAIRHFRITGDTLILALGIVALVGGLGLTVYAFFLVRKLDKAKIR